MTKPSFPDAIPTDEKVPVLTMQRNWSKIRSLRYTKPRVNVAVQMVSAVRLAENRSIADWLMIRVLTLVPCCRRARNKTTSTVVLARIPNTLIISPTVNRTCKQRNRPGVAGMEAKYRPAQRQAKETMDGQCQRGCRSQRIYTEGDRTNSTVPGQEPMEKLRHWQAIRPTSTAVQGTRYKVNRTWKDKDILAVGTVKFVRSPVVVSRLVLLYAFCMMSVTLSLIVKTASSIIIVYIWFYLGDIVSKIVQTVCSMFACSPDFNKTVFYIVNIRPPSICVPVSLSYIKIGFNPSNCKRPCLCFNNRVFSLLAA